ncbi:MAG: flagellar biosynthesis protein FliQ [Gammaproteobacteria bacterium]
MEAPEALEVARSGVVVILKIASPVMLLALVVGLTVSLFQALTQMQEMTLSFVPKILAIFTSLIVFMPFMLATLTAFMQGLADRIVGFG